MKTQNERASEPRIRACRQRGGLASRAAIREEEEVEEDKTRVVVAVVVVDSEVVRALWTRWRVRRTGGR